MTIEVHQPELAALIQQHMATGRFQTVEDFLFQALRSGEVDPQPAPDRPVLSLLEVFDRAREILDGEELVIERDPSPGHVVDLS